jgi:hypothetical protein
MRHCVQQSLNSRASNKARAGHRFPPCRDSAAWRIFFAENGARSNQIPQTAKSAKVNPLKINGLSCFWKTLTDLTFAAHFPILGMQEHKRPPKTTKTTRSIIVENAMPEWADERLITSIFGLGRTPLYNLRRAGKIRSVSTKTDGAKYGKRLFHVASIREFLAQQEQSEINGKGGAQ